jgi:hypothetical protein
MAQVLLATGSSPRHREVVGPSFYLLSIGLSTNITNLAAFSNCNEVVGFFNRNHLVSISSVNIVQFPVRPHFNLQTPVVQCITGVFFIRTYIRTTSSHPYISPFRKISESIRNFLRVHPITHHRHNHR